jgi:hypothetical protein
VPFPESSLNEEAGKLVMENYDEYCKHAKIFTELYARPQEEKNVLKRSNNNAMQVQSNRNKIGGTTVTDQDQTNPASRQEGKRVKEMAQANMTKTIPEYVFCCSSVLFIFPPSIFWAH